MVTADPSKRRKELSWLSLHCEGGSFLCEPWASFSSSCKLTHTQMCYTVSQTEWTPFTFRWHRNGSVSTVMPIWIDCILFSRKIHVMIHWERGSSGRVCMKRQIVLESRSDSYPNGHFPSRCICLWFLDLSPISSLNGTQWNLIVYV